MAFRRYESYKDTDVQWLDKIPAHWELKKNKFLFKEMKACVGKNASQYTLLSLTLKGVIARDMENPQGKFPAEFNTYKIVEPNDLVFCLFDIEETPRTIGLAQQHGMITGAYTVMKCNEEVSARYLNYYYLSLDFDKKLKPLYTGLRKVIQRDTFMSIKTAFPPCDEQDRIANFLDQKTTEIDEAIAKKQRLIELLKEQKAILINQAVTKGLNPAAPMRDSGVPWIGEIPAHWEVKKLKYYSEVQSGITLGKLYSGNKLVTAPYLRVANVQDGHFKLDEIAELQLPQSVIDQYLVRVGDILVTEGGDIDKLGRGTVWEGEINDCIHQNHIFAIRIYKSIASGYFVSLAMGADYGRKYFTHTANKTTNLASTNQTKLGNFPIALPPPSEQKLIIDYANGINSSYGIVIETAEKEIATLCEFKQTFVAEAVTGKIRI